MIELYKIFAEKYDSNITECITLDENTLDMQPISFHQSASVSTHTMLVNV